MGKNNLRALQQTLKMKAAVLQPARERISGISFVHQPSSHSGKLGYDDGCSHRPKQQYQREAAPFDQLVNHAVSDYEHDDSVAPSLHGFPPSRPQPSERAVVGDREQDEQQKNRNQPQIVCRDERGRSIEGYLSARPARNEITRKISAHVYLETENRVDRAEHSRPDAEVPPEMCTDGIGGSAKKIQRADRKCRREKAERDVGTRDAQPFYATIRGRKDVCRDKPPAREDGERGVSLQTSKRRRLHEVTAFEFGKATSQSYSCTSR